MPYDGAPVNGACALLDRILQLQALGLSSWKIAHRLNESADVVRCVAKCAGSPFSLTRNMVFSPVPKGPTSPGLVAALEELSSGRCAYIERDTDDPMARPCGAPCCASRVKGGKARRSSWCLEHHLVVYSEVANADVPRRVYEENLT